MITWKKYKNTESCFSTAFREEHPEIAKQLSDAKGFYIEGKKVVVGQYEYSVKKVPKKDKNTDEEIEGEFYTFIERKPYSVLGEESENDIAAKITKTEYAQKDADRQAKIEKAHQENLEVARRQALAQQTTADNTSNINETLVAILFELRRIAYAQESKHEV